MKKQRFWHENEGYIDAVMNKVNTLAEDTYIYMLHLSQNYKSIFRNSEYLCSGPL